MVEKKIPGVGVGCSVLPPTPSKEGEYLDGEKDDSVRWVEHADHCVRGRIDHLIEVKTGKILKRKIIR